MSDLSKNLEKCIQGYHLVNIDPVKEAVWEAINVQVLNASNIPVIAQSSGSHAPGSDITCSMGCFSNKSAKYDTAKGVRKDSFSISSYRLTSVCSASDPSNPATFIAEINRRKNFQYYSILVREEQQDNILYDWYLVPSDYHALIPSTYEWSPLIGQRGKNKEQQIGWQTLAHPNGSSMSISFGMSSQLWMYVNVTDEFRQFLISSTQASKACKYNYLQLFDMIHTK